SRGVWWSAGRGHARQPARCWTVEFARAAELVEDELWRRGDVLVREGNQGLVAASGWLVEII
ncbi:MAG: hypothetical protein QOE41_4953, partial [Mycobacterium sp.]|nr:hypothetical protein [Mycobacterium sp.]